MRKYIICAFVAIALAAILYLKPSCAESGNFAGVMPFTTGSGFTGLFDQNSGKIYIYDDALNNCISVYQVEKLGQPIKHISAK